MRCKSEEKEDFEEEIYSKAAEGPSWTLALGADEQIQGNDQQRETMHLGR